MPFNTSTASNIIISDALPTLADPGAIVFLTTGGVGVAGIYQAITSNIWTQIPLTGGAAPGNTVGTSPIISGIALRMFYETAGNLLGEVSGATSDGTTVTLTSPVITNISPGADFTLTQNSVTPFVSINSGAIATTLKLDSGIILVGSSSSKTSATSGSIVLPNNIYLRGTTSAGTNTRGLIGFLSTNQVSIDFNALGTIFGGSISVGTGGVFPTTNGGVDSGKANNAWRSTYTGHLIGNYSIAVPSLAAGAGAGTTPTLSVVGTDLSGIIKVITGTIPTGSNAIIVTTTFTVPYTAAPVSIVLFPANAATTAIFGTSSIYVDQAAISTTSFTINSGTTALAASTDYRWFYIVIQ